MISNIRQLLSHNGLDLFFDALMAIKFEFSLIFIESKINFVVEHDFDAFKHFITFISVEISKLVIIECNIFGSKKIVE